MEIESDVPVLDLKNEMKSMVTWEKMLTGKDKFDLDENDEPCRLVLEIEQLVLELEIREEEGTSRVV